MEVLPLLLPLVFLNNRRLKGLDEVLALAVLLVCVYFFGQAERILDEGWEFGAPETATYLSILLWVLLLAALLFWPMSKLIWVLSVRRLQRKLARNLDETELSGQMNRARIISVFVSITFSFLYNLSTLGLPAGG